MDNGGWTEMKLIAPFTLAGYVVTYRTERNKHGSLYSTNTYTGLTPDRRVPVFESHETSTAPMGWAYGFQQDMNGVYGILRLHQNNVRAAEICAAMAAGERWYVSPSPFIYGSESNLSGDVSVFHVAEISLTQHPANAPAREDDITGWANTVTDLVKAALDLGKLYSMEPETVMKMLQIGRLLDRPVSRYKVRIQRERAGVDDDTDVSQESAS